jgi:hypothetical protein
VQLCALPVPVWDIAAYPYQYSYSWVQAPWYPCLIFFSYDSHLVLFRFGPAQSFLGSGPTGFMIVFLCLITLFSLIDLCIGKHSIAVNCCARPCQQLFLVSGPARTRNQSSFCSKTIYIFIIQEEYHFPLNINSSCLIEYTIMFHYAVFKNC